MKDFFLRFFSAEQRLKTLAILSIVVIGAALIGLLGYSLITRSSVVTQMQIAEGWKTANLTITDHTIQQKENFWKVARKYGVDIDTIVAANPDLEKLNAARGQTIRVPNQKGVLHKTTEQETLPILTALYNVPTDRISSLNNIGPDCTLTPGLEVFIPGAKPKKISDQMASQFSLRGIFASPLPGRITSGMGMRKHPVGGFRGRHTGIDLSARVGTNIAAAAAGTVSQTGEGEYIGKFVMISHSDSYTTIYGHCSQILVTPGKTVKKGQIIAKSGQTGRVTGPHLHFEIRKSGVPQNPLKYLW